MYGKCMHWKYLCCLHCFSFIPSAQLLKVSNMWKRIKSFTISVFLEIWGENKKMPTSTTFSSIDCWKRHDYFLPSLSKYKTATSCAVSQIQAWTRHVCPRRHPTIYKIQTGSWISRKKMRKARAKSKPSFFLNICACIVASLPSARLLTERNMWNRTKSLKKFLDP